MECLLFKGISHAGQLDILREDTRCEIIRATNLPDERYFVFNKELGVEFCLTREQVKTDIEDGAKILKFFDKNQNKGTAITIKIGDIVKTSEQLQAIVFEDLGDGLFQVYSFEEGFELYDYTELNHLWSTGLCHEAIRVIIEAKFLQNNFMMHVITNANNSVSNQQILRDFNVLTLAISQLLYDLGLEDPELRLRDGLRVVMKRVENDTE